MCSSHKEHRDETIESCDKGSACGAELEFVRSEAIWKFSIESTFLDSNCQLLVQDAPFIQTCFSASDNEGEIVKSIKVSHCFLTKATWELKIASNFSSLSI